MPQSLAIGYTQAKMKHDYSSLLKFKNIAKKWKGTKQKEYEWINIQMSPSCKTDTVCKCPESNSHELLVNKTELSTNKDTRWESVQAWPSVLPTADGKK